MPGIPFSLATPDTPTVFSLCLFWSPNRCRFQSCPQDRSRVEHQLTSENKWKLIHESLRFRGTIRACWKDETSSWDLVQQRLGTSRPRHEGFIKFPPPCVKAIGGVGRSFLHLSPPLSLQLFFHIGGNANGREIQPRHIGISLQSCSSKP